MASLKSKFRGRCEEARILMLSRTVWICSSFTSTEMSPQICRKATSSFQWTHFRFSIHPILSQSIRWLRILTNNDINEYTNKNKNTLQTGEKPCTNCQRLWHTNCKQQSVETVVLPILQRMQSTTKTKITTNIQRIHKISNTSTKTTNQRCNKRITTKHDKNYRKGEQNKRTTEYNTRTTKTNNRQ